jgi:hypothetical protein
VGPYVALVNLSDATAVSAADIDHFNGRWMQPAMCQAEVASAARDFSLRQPGWATAERMAAMVRMFELTHDLRFLNHLRELTEIALAYRDDHYPGNPDPACRRCEPRPLDDFRGGHVAAWGHATDYYAGLSGVDEGISSVFAYPMAAFARIVAEDPSLQDAYAATAVRYANAAAETMWALMPQMQYQAVGNAFEGYLAHPVAYATKLTNCNGNHTCENLHDFAGAPMAHNENGAFMMVLIELWRVLDSPFYRQSAPQTADVQLARSLIPVVVSRYQRFFVNHLQTLTDTGNGHPRFSWHHEDGIPHSVHVEDIAHGALDMRYVDVLRRNFDRLNAVVASPSEPILLDNSILARFANTFLWKIAERPWSAGLSNLAHDVNGGGRGPANNAECDGWAQLAAADPAVYQICREVTLRVLPADPIDPRDHRAGQYFLTIGAHSALLTSKQFDRSATGTPRDREPRCGPAAC